MFPQWPIGAGTLKFYEPQYVETVVTFTQTFV